MVRIAVGDVSEMGRNTQGVRLIRLTKGEKLVEIEKIEVLSDDVETDESPDSDHDSEATNDNTED